MVPWTLWKMLFPTAWFALMTSSCYQFIHSSSVLEIQSHFISMLRHSLQFHETKQACDCLRLRPCPCIQWYFSKQSLFFCVLAKDIHTNIILGHWKLTFWQNLSKVRIFRILNFQCLRLEATRTHTFISVYRVVANVNSEYGLWYGGILEKGDKNGCYLIWSCDVSLPVGR